MRTLKLAALTVLAALFTLPAATDAQELAQEYMVRPAADVTTPEFEEALQQHAEWREENGDPWSWSVYDVVQGKHSDMYVIRSGGHEWSDWDAYSEGFGSEGARHFQENVGPMVGSMKSAIVEGDSAQSHWPDEGREYRLFSVTTAELKNGKEGDFYDAIEKVREAVRQEDHPFRFATVTVEFGAEDGHVRFVVPHENWADFQDFETPLGALMEEVYGEDEAEEIYEEYIHSIEDSYNMVVRYQPELSVNTGQ